MITTSEITPSPALAPFLRCYSYIEFDTKAVDFIRPTNAVNEMALTFQFKAEILLTGLVRCDCISYK